jgi:hypothetical protein
MASSWVLSGTPVQEMAGDVLAPLHVYWASMNPPSVHGAEATKPLPGWSAAPVVGGAAVVVVMIDSVWFGPAGRRVRPSLEQATSISIPRVRAEATAARRITAIAR